MDCQWRNTYCNNPRIDTVLKNFHYAAEHSLNGPSDCSLQIGHPGQLVKTRTYKSVFKEDYSEKFHDRSPDNFVKTRHPQFVRDRQSFFRGPLLLTMDNTSCETDVTILEGETIACFNIGGEKRLCLPQIIKKILISRFTLQEINAIYEDLHIFNSICSLSQLEALKCQEIIPANAPSCGLITKTDASRLCSMLLHRHGSTTVQAIRPSAQSFRVMHKCFGKCEGLLVPDLYKSPMSPAIRCSDCSEMFSPSLFVCHSHRSLENSTCHWGFDSANWRTYLLLSKGQEKVMMLQRKLDDLKAKFDDSGTYKRHQPSFTFSGEQNEVECVAEKRPCLEMKDEKYVETGWSGADYTEWGGDTKGELDKLHCSDESEIPSFLNTGTPMLLHPDKVVPFVQKTDDRCDKHFAPNVSLAPEEYGSKLREIENESEDWLSKDGKFHSPYASSSSSFFDNENPGTAGRSLRRFPVTSVESDDSDSPEMKVPILQKMEREVFQLALDLPRTSSEEAKDELLAEFVGMQKMHLVLVSQLIEKKQKIEMEFDSAQELLKKVISNVGKEQKAQELEIQELRREDEERMRQMEDEILSLQNKVDELNTRNIRSDVGLMNAKHKARVELYKRKLHTAETTTAELMLEHAKARNLPDMTGGSLAHRRQHHPSSTPSSIANADAYMASSSRDGNNGYDVRRPIIHSP